MEGGGSIGMGWIKGGTGRLDFLLQERRVSYFNKEEIIINTQTSDPEAIYLLLNTVE